LALIDNITQPESGQKISYYYYYYYYLYGYWGGLITITAGVRFSGDINVIDGHGIRKIDKRGGALLTIRI
jgi:hypothetical protein